MADGPQKLENKYELVIKAWKQFRPDKSFQGVTLEQFEALVKPSQDIRARMAALQAELDGTVATRTTCDQVTRKAIRNLVNTVKGDPDEGEDGEFYGALGYVRQSERKHGLTRKKKQPPSE